MNLSNYCTIAGLSILFLVGCLINLRENDIFKLKVVRKFQKLIYALIVQIVIDCLFAMLEGHNVETAALYLIKTIEFLLDAVLVLLVFNIFYKRSSKDPEIAAMTKIHNAMIIDLVFIASILTISTFGWRVFTIDENNIYHRGPLMPVFLAALIVEIGLLVYGIFLNSQRNQSVMVGTLLSFTTLIIVGTVLRDLMPSTNYDFLCMSVSMPFLIIYYAQAKLRIDPLTKLLNRQVYQRALERIDYTTLVVMIDVNNFKEVNDTRGHRYGDYALRDIAHLICKAYGKYAYCYRIGGDEFCAILKPGAFEKLVEKTPQYDAYLVAANFTKRLDNLIRAKAQDANNHEPYLKYGISQGYGIFYAEDNSSDDIFAMSPDLTKRERKSLLEVIDLADSKMYEEKNLFRQNQTQTQAEVRPQEFSEA